MQFSLFSVTTCSGLASDCVAEDTLSKLTSLLLEEVTSPTGSSLASLSSMTKISSTIHPGKTKYSIKSSSIHNLKFKQMGI